MARSVCSLAVALAIATGGGALAQEAVKGVYLGSQELCAQAKKDGLQSVIEASNMILTNDGFESIEFNCLFLQLVKHPRMPGGWVITSMCEVPDHAYPEMFSVVERRAGEIDIAALSEANSQTQEAEPGTDGGEAGGSSGLSGTYFFCEGVSPP